MPIRQCLLCSYVAIGVPPRWFSRSCENKRYAYLVGECRLGADAASGVVDADLRSFAVPNLYITDESVLPTQGSANQALTIMAVVARCADRLISANRG
jgi:choline dehydrogenase-like flavoprotein